jgi:urea transporter
VGSTAGMLTGLALGANGVAIYNGLWGFNSFDAALAVGGVFFVLTWRSGLLAVACAVLAALMFGAIAELDPVAVEDITTPEEHLTGKRATVGEDAGRVAMPA